jgi:hypothetical protein
MQDMVLNGSMSVTVYQKNDTESVFLDEVFWGKHNSVCHMLLPAAAAVPYIEFNSLAQKTYDNSLLPFIRDLNSITRHLYQWNSFFIPTCLKPIKYDYFSSSGLSFACVQIF